MFLKIKAIAILAWMAVSGAAQLRQATSPNKSRRTLCELRIFLDLTARRSSSPLLVLEDFCTNLSYSQIADGERESVFRGDFV